MKTIILSMMLCIGAFANSDSFYQDDEIGLAIQVPEELKRTWNISNSQTGFNLTVFNTDEEQDNLYVMAIGKMPFADDEDLEELLPAILNELFENFSSSERTYITDEVMCYVEQLSPLALDLPQRYRVHLMIEEIQEAVRLDVQLFFTDNFTCFILTGGFPCEATDNLDDFSEKVFANVSFIED